MARGWESKGVEAQQDALEESRKRPKVTLTPEQLAAERTRDALLLHRTRVLRDLESCQDERYRKTLAEGLAYLEEKLVALGWTRPE